MIAPEDIALILHTSGTTSKPKMVPLTHLNLCTSAKNIVETLKLNRSDRCINIMPLFHIHGIVCLLLSSLYSGGSIVTLPGFNGLKFFALMKNKGFSQKINIKSSSKSMVLRPGSIKKHKNSMISCLQMIPNHIFDI